MGNKNKIFISGIIMAFLGAIPHLGAISIVFTVFAAMLALLYRGDTPRKEKTWNERYKCTYLALSVWFNVIPFVFMLLLSDALDTFVLPAIGVILVLVFWAVCLESKQMDVLKECDKSKETENTEAKHKFFTKWRFFEVMFTLSVVLMCLLVISFYPFNGYMILDVTRYYTTSSTGSSAGRGGLLAILLDNLDVLIYYTGLVSLYGYGFFSRIHKIIKEEEEQDWEPLLEDYLKN